MQRITEIRSERRGSKRREVYLDGEPWRSVSSAVVAAAGIAEGDEIDAATLLTAIEDLEPRSAKDRALHLLSFKDRSHAGLVTRLAEDGYPREVGEAVARDLERLGFIDDARFAGAFARTLVEIRRMGRSRAVRELIHAGIEEQLAHRAVDEALPADREAQAALVIARSVAQRSGATVEKVAARLIRKGYRGGIALDAARAALEERSRDAEDPRADMWDGI